MITSKASNIVKRSRESEQDFRRALGNLHTYSNFSIKRARACMLQDLQASGIYNIYIFEGEKVLKVLALPKVRWPFYIFMNKRSTRF